MLPMPVVSGNESLLRSRKSAEVDVVGELNAQGEAIHVNAKANANPGVRYKEMSGKQDGQGGEGFISY